MKINYRPEIDGLRAISVFAVIFYHANFIIYGNFFFQGGFLGVDIFFVISGYLITSLILKEIKTSGKFNFLNFYQRRIRRILPVLIFITLFFIPLAWLNLLPTKLLDFSNSIFSSTFFSSNFFFIFSSQEYGHSSSILKPFLHTWSLSVEEQFYIFYPLFVILCFKYLKNKFFFLLILFSGLSLILAQLGSSNFSILNFYLLPTRVWELFCGAILANIEIDYKNVIPIDKQEIPPLIVASFDIEADSSHGDFPLAKKDYKKLANQLVVSYLNKKNKLSKLSKTSEEYELICTELKSYKFFKDRIIQAFDLPKKYIATIAANPIINSAIRNSNSIRFAQT